LNSVLSGLQSKAKLATFLVMGAHNKFGPEQTQKKESNPLPRAAARRQRSRSRAPRVAWANEQNPDDHQIGKVFLQT
jgi:hypothetical protein